MTRLSWKRIAILITCVGISLLWTNARRAASHDGIAMADFGGIYVGSRCALNHHDPYDPKAVLQEFKDEGGTFPAKDPVLEKIIPIVITVGVNLPTALFLVAPLAMLPWGVAQTLWILLTVALLLIAGYLMWSLSGNAAPVLSGVLIAIMLANCEQLLMVGNVAGIAVSLCVIATWCFLKERYVVAGIVLCAISLALKPHDSGFVWLYFLLAGGLLRKRALQALAVTGVIGMLAAVWIAPLSPHWIQELHANHIAVSQVGSTSDPALTGITSGKIGSIIDLQAALSVWLKDPHTYNRATYLVVGLSIAVWMLFVLRRVRTPESHRLAIAAIAVLTLLPVYHRPYDAKLLMLTVPACAMLWAEGGAKRWLALTFTLGGVLLTSEVPLAILIICSKALAFSPAFPSDKTVIVLLFPPLALLSMGCFFLWAYVRYLPKLLAQPRNETAIEPMRVPAPSLVHYAEPDLEQTNLIACVANDGVKQ